MKSIGIADIFDTMTSLARIWSGPDNMHKDVGYAGMTHDEGANPAETQHRKSLETKNDSLHGPKVSPSVDPNVPENWGQGSRVGTPSVTTG